MIGLSTGFQRPRGYLGVGAPPVNLTSNIKVLTIRDSTGTGVGAGDGGTSDVNGARPFNNTLQCRDRLNARGITAVANDIVGTNVASTSTDWNAYRSDILATGIGSSSNSPTAGGIGILMSTGDSLQFTTSTAVDTVEFTTVNNSAHGVIGVRYWNGSSFVDLSSHTLDGVPVEAAVTVDTDNGGADEYVKYVVGGFPLQVHTFEFYRVSDAVHGPMFVNAWDSSIFSIQMLCGGIRNWTTEDWIVSDDVCSPLNAIAVIAPDIIEISLGINNCRQPVANGGTTIATFKSQMQTLINACVSAGATVILTVPNDIQTYVTVDDVWSFAAMTTAYEQLHAANPGSILRSVGEICFNAGLSGAANPATYAVLDANGYMNDGLHPNEIVYAVDGADLGDTVITLLGLTAATAIPTFTVTDPTFSMDSGAVEDTDFLAAGDEAGGASFSATPAFGLLTGGTDAADFKVNHGDYRLTPSTTGDTGNLPNGPYEDLAVTYVKDGVVSRNTVTVNIT